MKVAVVYWSSTGNTETMANAVVKGIIEAGSEAELLTATQFDIGMVNNYDAFAFGCPSMGDEVLEESEFAPMFESVLPALANKKVVLFGSYGWGDGTWMRNWEAECRSNNVDLVKDGLIINYTPDADGEAQCEELGKALVA